MHTDEIDIKYKKLASLLSPDRPIRSSEFLRGRSKELDRIVNELSHFYGVPFIFGNRGVGKTSLARTAAQLVTSADREHIYIACAPSANMLSIFREIAHALLMLLIKKEGYTEINRKLDSNVSLNPGIRMTVEKKTPSIDEFHDVNEAVRTLHEIDELASENNKTTVVIDELEELDANDRKHLAYLVKQIGDQEFKIKYMLVGIADNVQDLIGAHQSVPRYIEEISLRPLKAQDLIDIVSEAGVALGISISEDDLKRIATIGNGYPHFSHLIGKALFSEAISREKTSITPDIYKEGIQRAVEGSVQELRGIYEQATHREDDIYRYIVWTIADIDVVDMRIDDIIAHMKILSQKFEWELPNDETISKRLQRLSQSDYGAIITNTPIQYGSREKRYRYKRFKNNLMRGHVRLIAESQGVELGSRVTI